MFGKWGFVLALKGNKKIKLARRLLPFQMYSMICFDERNYDDIADGSGVTGSFFKMGEEGGAFVVKLKGDNLSGMFGEKEEKYSDC